MAEPADKRFAELDLATALTGDELVPVSQGGVTKRARITQFPTSIPGPQGPVGPTGPTGPQGPAGPSVVLPGGNAQVLFNDGGVLGADVGMVFDKVGNHLALSGMVISGDAIASTAGTGWFYGFGGDNEKGAVFFNVGKTKYLLWDNVNFLFEGGDVYAKGYRIPLMTQANTVGGPFVFAYDGVSSSAYPEFGGTKFAVYSAGNSVVGVTVNTTGGADNFPSGNAGFGILDFDGGYVTGGYRHVIMKKRGNATNEDALENRVGEPNEAENAFPPDRRMWTPWAQGQVISAIGTVRTNGIYVYTSTNTGTTGATAPVHTAGTVSDGGVSWAYTKKIPINAIIQTVASLGSGSAGTHYNAWIGTHWDKNGTYGGQIYTAMYASPEAIINTVLYSDATETVGPIAPIVVRHKTGSTSYTAQYLGTVADAAVNLITYYDHTGAVRFKLNAAWNLMVDSLSIATGPLLLAGNGTAALHAVTKQQLDATQPLDATLTALAGLNTTAGLVEQTGTDAFTKRAIGVGATTSIPTRADGDARWQTLDTTLTALAGVTTAADKLIYATGADTFATTDLTAFGRSLIDDADATAARTTLAAAPLASPTFTGTPSLPTGTTGVTQAVTDDSTKLATTAFVKDIVPTGAYTAYTPTVTSGSGTITNFTATGRYQQTGKRVDVQITVTMTDNGSGAGWLNVSLPVTSGPTASFLYGGEVLVTGKMCKASVGASGTNAVVMYYDHSYPGVSGGALILAGSYEAA